MKHFKVFLHFLLLFSLCLCLSTASTAETREQRKFDEAMSKLATGNYSQAAQEFLNLGAFEQAPYWAMYARALGYMEEANWRLAESTFRFLGYFQDSQLRLTYDLPARRYEAIEEYEKANELYSQFPAYLDFETRIERNKALILERDYQKADQAEKAGQLEEAFNGFSTMPTYRDSMSRAASVQLKIQEEAYRAADAFATEGEFQQAYEAFLELSPYKDSDERATLLLEQIHALDYEAADKLDQLGQQQEALDAFMALGNYKDSKDRADAILNSICEANYMNADRLAQDGQALKAFQMFSSLWSDYQFADSDQRATSLQNAAKYEEGLNQISSGLYSAALATYSGLGDYKDSGEKAYSLGVLEFAQNTQQLTQYKFAYQFHDVWGLVNTTDNIITPARWERIDTLSSRLFRVFDQNGKVGVLGSDGQLLLTPIYEQIGDFDKFGNAKVVVDSMWGLMSRSGTLLIEPTYSSISDFDQLGLSRVSLNGKIGLMNITGTIICDLIYDSISPFDIDNELAIVEKDSKFGYIDISGQEIIPCQWDAISGINKDYCTVARVENGTVFYGIINGQNEEIAPPIWRVIGLSGTNANSRLGIAEPDFSQGFTKVLDRDNRWALLSSNGSILGNKTWDAIGVFHEGLADVKDNNSYGFINVNGDVIIEPIYSSVQAFSEGFAVVRGQNGLYGYVSRNGDLIADLQYQVAEPFKDKHADVYIADDGWHIIGIDGARIYVTDDQIRSAEALLTAGNYQEAAEAFEAIQNNVAAKTRGQFARYKLAEWQFENGLIEDALENYLKAGTYHDAIARSQMTSYQIAERTLGQGDSIGAAQLFEAAIPYADAENRAMEIYFEKAKELQSNGYLDEALAYYLKCSELEDAALQIRAIRIKLAEKATDNEDWETAISLYIAAGDDAETRNAVRNVRLAQSDALTLAGDYDGALTILDLLESEADWEDHNEQTDRPISKVLLLLASVSKSDQPLRRASSVVSDKSSVDEEVNERRTKLLYAKAESQLLEGDYKGAEETYLSVNDADKALEARIQQVQALLALQDWNQADLLLQKAYTDYPNHEDRINDERYKEALLLKDAGQYEACITILNELSTKIDVDTQPLMDAKYLYAVQLMDHSSYEAAHEYLEQIKEYKDANSLVEECSYLQAASLLDSGDSNAALQIYLKITDYKDVSTILQQNPSIRFALSEWQKTLVEGDIVSFGHTLDKDTNDSIPMQWMILSIDDNKALLIAENWVEKMGFMSYKSIHPTWQHSSLRAYLNGEFLDDHFDEYEISSIQPTYLKAVKPVSSSFSPGNHTEDYIFILSHIDIEHYKDVLKTRLLKLSDVCWTRSIYGQGMITCYWSDTLKSGTTRSSEIAAYVRPVMWVNTSAIH